MHAGKVILFDAAGTLFHLPRGAGWHYADVGTRLGAPMNADEVETAFRAVWKSIASPQESDGPRADDNREWWRRFVHQVLDRLSSGGPADREFYFEELWKEFAQPGIWELYPDTRESLVSLGQTWRLGIISNFDSRLHAILGNLGISHFFEHIVVSSEVGADKPSPRIFQEALDRFDVPAGAVLHVGDDPVADWRGATEAGLAAFELKRPDRTLRDVAAFARKILG